jgi:hypothetical protein
MYQAKLETGDDASMVVDERVCVQSSLSSGGDSNVRFNIVSSRNRMSRRADQRLLVSMKTFACLK